jgi:ADP-ribose pyrophosphatase YjhB (NUDIX family)
MHLHGPGLLMAEESRLEPKLPPFLQRLLHRYWRFSRGMTLGVRAAVLDDAGRVFLVRHTYVPGWHLPGGGVEPGETGLDALARELREEACIELAAAPRLHGVYLNRHASDRDHVLLYVVREFRVTAAKGRDREIAEAGFFALEALPDGVTAGTAARLEEIGRGGAPSPVW